MNKTFMKVISGHIIATFLLMIIPNTVVANEYPLIKDNSTYGVQGDYYKLSEGSDYVISKTEPDMTIEPGTGKDFGVFSITGNVKSIADVKDFANNKSYTAFEVSGGDVSLHYKLDSKYKNASDKEWHISDDSCKKVDGMKLSSKVKSGAVIVRSSRDGKTWVTDKTYTDVQKSSSYKETISNPNEIQLNNGCYYRIYVAYELKKLDKTYVKIKTYDYFEYVEVYEFYLVSSADDRNAALSPEATPKKTMGETKCIKTNEGYTGVSDMKAKDPHYGWDIGEFWINGYSKEVNVDGNTIYLKKPGDRVVLWFELLQDIKCLNNNKNLVIENDKGAYDEHYQISKTNFKHGTLIIQFTDHEGKKSEPIIYTDFLKANAATGADTRVQLFEEGDYEVTLDYNINDKKGIDEHTYYQINFKFSIRNGKCAVYPFDLSTNSNLEDGDITANGFKIDLAKSRYLDVSVARSEIQKSGDIYKEVSKSVDPCKDSDTYSATGKYVITVNNKYDTEAPTLTKTIYVGTDPVLKAMSKGKSLDDINDLLESGYVLCDDGTFKKG